MKITWKDIKESVYNMMALESGEYDEYLNKIITAANYALIEVSKEFANINQYKIIQTLSDETGYDSYDLKELTKTDDGEVTFLGFAADCPLLKNNNGNMELTDDFSIIADRYLYLNKQETGEFIVNYRLCPKFIDNYTSDDFEMELSYEAANLLPVLISWRAYLDDDITRATMYYNEYQDLSERLSAKRGFFKPIYIHGGVSI